MTGHISFPPSKFKMIENKVHKYKNKYIKQSHKVVFGSFYIFTMFAMAKQHLIRDSICQTRNIHVISRIF